MRNPKRQRRSALPSNRKQEEEIVQTQVTGDTYIRGNIVRIYMENFLTFNKSVIRPSAKLNLIIGPNGTGKSSVVNAICIAFGGKLQLLGRSGDLASFVRHGATKSTVEVWLHDPTKPSGLCKVRREFDVENQSSFFLDGKPARVKDIATIAREYDVQLDNLSQFMPQEKIADFVGFKPSHLLEISVRSLGGTDKVEQLSKLQKSDELFRKEDGATNKREMELQELITRNEESREEVEAYKQQKEVKRVLQLARDILPHRQAEELRNELTLQVQLKRDADEAAQELRKQMRMAETGALKELHMNCKAVRQDIAVAKGQMKKADEDQTVALRNVAGLEENIIQTRLQLDNVDRAVQRHETRVQDASNKVEEFESRLQRLKEQFDVKADNDALAAAHNHKGYLREEQNRERAAVGGLDNDLHYANQEINRISVRINGLQDVRSRRIQMIDRIPRHEGTVRTLQMIDVLMQHRRFKGRVYGPLGAEINCHNQYYARIMESCVSGWLVGAFVTENKVDANLLISECRNRYGARHTPDVVTAPTDAYDNYDREALFQQRPDRPVDDRLRRLGIESIVPEIFDAEEVVRCALNAQANLHKIYVGTDNAKNNMEALQQEPRVQVWYTPDARVQVLRSRYDPNSSSLKMDTKFSRLSGDIYMGSSRQVDEEKRRYMEEMRVHEENRGQILNQKKIVTEKIQRILADIDKADNEMREIKLRTVKRENLEKDLGRAIRELEHAKQRRDANDAQAEKDKYKEKILQLESRVVNEVPLLVRSLVNWQEQAKKHESKLVDRVIADRELEQEKEKNQELEDKLKDAEALLETRKTDAKNLKAKWKAKQTEAANAISEDRMQEEADTIREWFEKDSTWLEGEIDRLNSQVQSLAGGGASVLRDYEDRERRIEELKKRITTDKTRVAQERETFAQEKNEFLEWLRTGVGHMREKFSGMYQRFGCAGDLELASSDSLEDLELQIMVSYRDSAALRPISASSNSGGEKMCCTMLFCFSLLHDKARKPPFIIVDELNQGLDPSNEMKIMRIMFEDADNGTSPQCFVVTPKLLPGLPFSENVKTHVIFNGNVKKANITQ